MKLTNNKLIIPTKQDGVFICEDHVNMFSEFGTKLIIQPVADVETKLEKDKTPHWISCGSGIVSNH